MNEIMQYIRLNRARLSPSRENGLSPEKEQAFRSAFQSMRKNDADAEHWQKFKGHEPMHIKSVFSFLLLCTLFLPMAVYLKNTPAELGWSAYVFPAIVLAMQWYFCPLGVKYDDWNERFLAKR